MTASAGSRLRARRRAEDTQLVLADVAASVRATHLGRAEAFVRRHRRRYLAFARAIDPDRASRAAVWQRLAWAILTVNATYERTREALVRCAAYGFGADPLPPRAFAGIPGMVPAKVKYLNALPNDGGIFGLLRTTLHGLDDVETWDAYRLRLCDRVTGLELIKASYAACMLYPLEADVACLDTGLLKVLGWASAFRSLPLGEYRVAEGGGSRDRPSPRRVDRACAVDSVGLHPGHDNGPAGVLVMGIEIICNGLACIDPEPGVCYSCRWPWVCAAPPGSLYGRVAPPVEPFDASSA